MKKYVDSCRTFLILLQDSGLEPKPREDWNTFVPALNDIAHVDENDKDYIFNGATWVEFVEGMSFTEPVLPVNEPELVENPEQDSDLESEPSEEPSDELSNEPELGEEILPESSEQPEE